MKRCICLLMIALLCTGVHAQYEYSCSEISEKIAGFTKMRNAGTGLLIGGIVMSALGIGLIASAGGETYYETGPQGSSGDPAGGLGAVLLIMLGIPGTIAGPILLSIGSRKRREYRELSAQRRCSVYLELDFNTVGLACHF